MGCKYAGRSWFCTFCYVGKDLPTAEGSNWVVNDLREDDFAQTRKEGDRREKTMSIEEQSSFLMTKSCNRDTIAYRARCFQRT